MCAKSLDEKAETWSVLVITCSSVMPCWEKGQRKEYALQFYRNCWNPSVNQKFKTIDANPDEKMECIAKADQSLPNKGQENVKHCIYKDDIFVKLGHQQNNVDDCIKFSTIFSAFLNHQSYFIHSPMSNCPQGFWNFLFRTNFLILLKHNQFQLIFFAHIIFLVMCC